MSGLSRTASALCLGTLLASPTGCAFLSGMTSSAGSAGPASAPASSEPTEDTSFSSAPSSTPSAAAAPEPPKPVSVKLRNGCSDTVKIFFGDKPKFGSGTYSSLSSNSSTNYSFMPGDMFWIVDESQNGLSSVTVAESTREIEVGSGCTSLSAR